MATDRSGAVLASSSTAATAAAESQPATVALANGAFITTSTDAAGDGSGTRISAQQDRLGRLSVGDGFDDIIVGDPLFDTVDGGNGADMSLPASPKSLSPTRLPSGWALGHAEDQVVARAPEDGVVQLPALQQVFAAVARNISQLAILVDNGNTQVSFGSNAVLLYN